MEAAALFIRRMRRGATVAEFSGELKLARLEGCGAEEVPAPIERDTRAASHAERALDPVFELGLVGELAQLPEQRRQRAYGLHIHQRRPVAGDRHGLIAYAFRERLVVELERECYAVDLERLGIRILDAELQAQ